MFRPYELPPSPPPMSQPPAALWKTLLGAPAGDPPTQHRLPADWDLLDPDQRVRAIGEW